MWHDLRQALRTLHKNPAFVALASTVLALGIGLNTAIFSIVYSMLFKPLPVEEPDRLVSIYQTTSKQPDRPFPIPNRVSTFFRGQRGIFSDLAMHWGVTYVMKADDETQTVNAEWVTSNYFSVLGVKAVLGRELRSEEDELANSERALVISHALWQRRFDGNPAVIGKEVILTPWDSPDLTFTVVGVMPPGFNGISEPWKPTHVWTTFVQGQSEERRRRYFSGVGIARLKPGIGVRRARAVVEAQSLEASEGVFAPGVAPRYVLFMTDDVSIPNNPSGSVVPVRLAGAMTVVVAMVLLVAATNVAGILTARGIGRSGEIAVRRVLGAGPLRIVRQLLAECLLLTLAGGALGLLLATWLLDVFRALTPLQYAFDVLMEIRVVLFTAAVCVVAGIVVGVMPALQATRLDILPWLSGSGATQTKRGGSRLRHAIALPQVAVSLVLLLVAGVHIRDLLKMELADLGYQTGNVIVLNPMLRLEAGERTADSRGFTDEQYADRGRRFYQHLMQRLRTIPGTHDMAVTSALPLHEPSERPNWAIVSRNAYLDGEREGPSVERASVSSGYFRTMGMRVLAGRDFDERDTRTMAGVVVLSASAAQTLWPGRSAVGQSLTVVSTWNRNDRVQWYEVVGVVSDVRPVLQERTARPFVYFAMSQDWRPYAAHVLVRGTDARSSIALATSAITGADPFADVRRVQTLSQMVAQILYPRRIAAAILAVSGAVALFLATVGIYGVVSYSVAQRTGEIGVRMALGAERGDIVRLVLREAGLVAALGSIGGLVLGYAAIRITSSRYLVLPAPDFATLLITPLALGVIVLLASWVPARRAGRVEPMEVLRRA
jgi:putative ABC transport system permease protein